MTRPPLSALLASLGFVALWFAGCGDVVAQPIGAAPGDGGASSSSGGAADGSAFDGLVPGDASAFCAGHGPIPLPGADGGTDQCTGDLAHVFRFAACACRSFAVSGQLLTEAFSSTADAAAAFPNGASIAANGWFATNAKTNVGGSVWAGGQNLGAATPAVALNGQGGAIAYDLQAGGPVTVGGVYQVGRDAFVDGSVTIQSGNLSVVGALHQPAGDSATGVTAGGGVVNGPVQVQPPCDCANPIDVASLVAARKTSNDDASIPLSPSALDQPSGEVTLPCGQYYVDGITGGAAPLQLQIDGRVALFVGGDVSVTQGLQISLAPGAELDLFVAGSVHIQGTTSLGDANAPARVRVYVGGPSFTLSATAMVGANVYAPNAVVQLASDFEMWGAVFAEDLQFSGYFKIHYDTSVLQTQGCTPPGVPCKTCDDCSGKTPSCKAGTCSACSTDADCCAPLVCDQPSGSCYLPAQ
jgi:hypothetical protein